MDHRLPWKVVIVFYCVFRAPIYGAGGHSKVIAEILESMGKTIYGIFDDNQCVEELGDKGRKGDTVSGENTFPVLESPVIISIGNM
jgi:acetyltransferase EpsM